MKKTEQVLLLEQFKQPENIDISHDTRNYTIQDSPEHEAGRIKRLEKLIKKRIWMFHSETSIVHIKIKCICNYKNINIP